MKKKVISKRKSILISLTIILLVSLAAFLYYDYLGEPLLSPGQDAPLLYTISASPMNSEGFMSNNYLVSGAGRVILDVSSLDEPQMDLITKSVDTLKIEKKVDDFFQINDQIVLEFNEDVGRRIRVDLKGISISESINSYIIEFKEEPLIKKEKDFGTLESEHNSAINDFKNRVRSGLTGNAIDDAEIKQEFYNVFNGVVIDATVKDIEEIRKSPYVKNIHPNKEVRAVLMDSVPLINAPEIWDSGYTGEGTTIAIIDTGIDYTHPDLGGCLGEGCKVVGGYDFINEDADPMDDHGHGTHCAGIAAGGETAAVQLSPLIGDENIGLLETGCTDSDVTPEYLDGKNPFVSGTCVDFNGTASADLCYQDTGRVFEYYCMADGLCGGEWHDCVDNCEARACIRDNPPVVVDRCAELSNEVKIKIAEIEADSGGYDVVKREGDEANEDDWVVLPTGVYKITQIYNNTGTDYTNDRVRLIDDITGTPYDGVFTSEGKGTISIGGKTRQVEFSGTGDNGIVSFTWIPEDEIDTFYCVIPLPPPTPTLREVKEINWHFDQVSDTFRTKDDNNFDIVYSEEGGYGQGSIYVGLNDPDWNCHINYPNDLHIQTTGDNNVEVSFIDSKSNAGTFSFAHGGSSLDYPVRLADSYNRSIRVVEGETIKESDYVVLGQSNDYGGIYLISIIYNNTGTDYTNDRVWLKDVITRETYESVFTSEGKGMIHINGRSYSITFSGSGDIGTTSITWGAGSNHGDVGDEQTVSPRIKLESGNWIALGTLDVLGQAYNLDVSGNEPAILFIENTPEEEVFILPVYKETNVNYLKIFDNILSTSDTASCDDGVPEPPVITGEFKGVAPGARLYAYKVLDSGGSGSYSNVISGIEAAVDPNNDGDFSDHVDVMSLSLGGGGDPDDAPSIAIDNAVRAGVIAVVAAGNSGPSPQSIGSPGTARKAITVGATDKNDIIAEFSSRGPVVWSNGSLSKPDLVAPGVAICSSQWEEAWHENECVDDEHTAISGTSMATPHVAGAAALMTQIFPDLTPEDIKGVLKSTSIDLGYDLFTQGAGRIDLQNAANSKILVLGDLSFGRMAIGQTTTTRPLRIKNIGDSEITVQFSVGSALEPEDGTVIDAVSMVPSVVVPANAEVEVDVNLDFPLVYGGSFYGKITLNDGQTNYNAFYAFSRYSSLNLEVEGDHYPNFYVHNTNMDKIYFAEQVWEIIGNKVSLTVKPGTYTVYAISDFINPLDPLNYPETEGYILIDTVEVPSDSETNKNFKLSDGRKFTIKARDLEGEELILNEWHTGVAVYENHFDLDPKTFSTNYHNALIGDRDFYLTDKPDNGLNTDIIFKYLGSKNE